MASWVNGYVKDLPCRSRDKDDTTLLRLDRNEPSFPPAPGVVRAIQEAAAGANRYPESGAPALREAIAAYAGCGEANVVVGNGSDEVIELLSRALLSNGDEIVVPIPSFFYYSTAARAVGAKVVGARRNPDFSISLSALREAISPRTKMVYIANPNNPTGTLEEAAALDAVLEARLPALVVVDECYFEYSGVTVADRLPRYDNLFVMRSFSKGFALAGLRVGYGLGSPELIEYLYRTAQSYAVNRLAQAAACAALADIPYARAQVAAVQRERERVGEALIHRGILVYPSAANFVVADFTAQGLASGAVVAGMKARGIALADFGSAPGLNRHCVRFTIGTEAENTRCLAALEEFLGS